MKKFVMTVMMLAMAGICALQAQTSFSLHAGLASPLGSYADATANYDANNASNDVLRFGLLDQTKKGGAGIGFNVGAQMNFGITSVKGLSIIVGADFFFNSINSDISDYVDEYISDVETSTHEYSITLPKYMHVPILVGANYTYDITDKIGIYGEGALGANMRFITNFELYDATVTTENINRIKYDMATTFAFRFGAGIVLSKRFTIGIGYVNHGSAKVKGTQTSEKNGVSNGSSQKFKGGNISAANLTVNVGIKF